MDIHTENKGAPPDYTDYRNMRSSTGAPNFLREALHEAGVNLPSWTRTFITFAIVVALGIGVWTVGSAVAAMFVAGAMSLTTSAFLLWIASFLGWCVTAYFGTKVIVGVARYILGGRVDNDLATARNKVLWAFTPDPKPAMA